MTQKKQVLCDLRTLFLIFNCQTPVIDLSDITPEEKLKYEIAEELGLLDKVLSEGWRSLSAKETGRIGGLIARKKREDEKK